MKTHDAAVFLVLFAACLYGLDAALMKCIGVQNPLIIASIRLVGTLLLLLCTYRAVPKITHHYKFYTSVVCSVLSSVCFITALQYIKVSEALLLFYGSMLWSCVWHLIAMRRVSGTDIFSACGTFFALIILFIDSDISLSPLGYLAGITSGVAFSGFLFWTESYQRDYPEKEIRFDSFIFAIIILIGLSWLYIFVSKIEMPSIKQRVYLLMDGVLYGLAYVLLFTACRLSHGRKSMIIVNTYLGAFEPFFAIFFAWFLLSEKTSVHVGTSFLIILTTLIVHAFLEYKKVS